MNSHSPIHSDNPALCVDLDGTLSTIDTLHEGVLRAFKTAPLDLLKALPLALKSKAAFKRRVADLAPLSAETLPFNGDVVNYVRSARAQGRRVDLISAADQSVVDQVAAHLDLFDAAIGSDGQTNLSAQNKLHKIRAMHGDDFIYAGDSNADRVIWQASDKAIVVGKSDFAKSAIGTATLEAHFDRPSPWKAMFRAMRPHQWAKNTLIFAPIILAGPGTGMTTLFAALFGFIALSCIASAGYVFNDLMDLDADRRHPTKCNRPLAAGTLTAAQGAVLFGVLIAIGAVIALALSSTFAAICALYFCGTMLYSFWLKRRPLVDILALASLYTIRIVAGTTLAAGAFSFWIFTFSMFIFASLAILKRYTELADEDLSDTVRKSRGYTAVDLPLLLPFGAGCSVSAALLFVIYLVEERFPSGVYNRPELLWLMFPVLLLWQMHMWRAAVHRKIHEDPVLFAIKDRHSRLMGLTCALILLLSW